MQNLHLVQINAIWLKSRRHYFLDLLFSVGGLYSSSLVVERGLCASANGTTEEIGNSSLFSFYFQAEFNV
jgi:hypothetical protein